MEGDLIGANSADWNDIWVPVSNILNLNFYDYPINTFFLFKEKKKECLSENSKGQMKKEA